MPGLIAAVFLLVIFNSLGHAATTPPDIRFQEENIDKDKGSVAVKPPKEYGIVNRVRHRVVPGTPLTIEREPVKEPDPQKGTLPRPEVIQGAAWIRESLGCAPAGATALGWGDFDADGSDELLIGWPLMICKRSPGGQWVRFAGVPIIGKDQIGKAENISIADVNADGLADIVVPAGEHPRVYRNVSWLPWIRHTIASGFRSQTAVAANFTGQERPDATGPDRLYLSGEHPDVVSGDIENDRRVSLFVAPSWKPVELISGIRVIQSLALDVDGDGYVDYVGAQYHPGLIFWLEHPKDPLHEKWTFHVIDDAKQGGADGVHGLALADIDGDGKPELIATSDWPQGGFPNSIVWFHLPAEPRSADRWQRSVLADRDAPGFAHYLGVGDVNRDGLLDIATGAKSGPDGNWFAWWQHPSAKDAAQPWSKHLIASGQPGATNILIQDLNGDRKPDFLASRGHGKGVVWFEAPSWTPHEINTTLVGPHALAIADLNEDGAPDFVVCAKDSGILAWYENDGHGGFTEHRLSEDQSAYEVKIVDMNGDGAPDILVAGEESQNVVWFENRLR